MSSAEPGSSSRKRSKWDEDGSGDDQPPYAPQPKRRTKPKSIRVAPPTEGDDARSDSPTHSSSVLTSAATRPKSKPAHSIFVPPRTHHPPIQPSRSVYAYEKLNQIEEGSYGVVFRARDKQTGDIVALKKLKLGEEKNGFPITALREIYALMSCRHENVVGIREVVVGDTLTQCVSYSFNFSKSLCNHGIYPSLLLQPPNHLLNTFQRGKGFLWLWTLSNTTSSPC